MLLATRRDLGIRDTPLYEQEQSQSQQDMAMLMTDAKFTQQLYLLFTTTEYTIFDYPKVERQPRRNGLRRRIMGSHNDDDDDQVIKKQKRKRECNYSDPDPAQDQTAGALDYSCIVCREHVPCVVFHPCGHACCCATCGSQSRINKCPICTRAIQHKIPMRFCGYVPDCSSQSSFHTKKKRKENHSDGES